jgi:flagellin FlaB
MNSKLSKLFKDESGITALETAIILIAFVVVAAIFAFTILSTGTFLTERSKEAAYAGLQEVRGSVEQRGSLIAYGVTSTNVVTQVVFTLANVAGGQPVDFSTSQRVVNIEYRDANQRYALSNWTTSWIGYNDGDSILEERELVEITAPLSGTLGTNLGVNTTFVVEIKPPVGAVLNLQRTTPAAIDPVMDLH